MKRFVVVGHARTGTTLLVQMLGSHPEVACYGEILNPDRTIDGSSRVTPELLERVFREGVEVDSLRKSTRPSIRMMRSKHHGAPRAVGFKILTDQWSDSPATQYISSGCDIDVISVRRRDMLATVASQVTARSRGIFSSSRPEDVARQKVRVGLDDIATQAAKERIWNLREPQLFKGHRILRVCYEDILAGWETESRRMLEFLGLPFVSLTTEMIKLGMPPAEAISNWTDLEQQSRGTRFEALFQQSLGDSEAKH